MNNEEVENSMKIHHMGIVVDNIETSLGEFSKLVKFENSSIPTLIGSQKVKVCFMKFGEFNIELIEPIGTDSPVHNFLEKGGGFHHICFEVENIFEKIEELKKKGATIIVEPVTGFENRLTAFVFLNMKDTNCNLIELASKNPEIF